MSKIGPCAIKSQPTNLDLGPLNLVMESSVAPNVKGLETPVHIFFYSDAKVIKKELTHLFIDIFILSFTKKSFIYILMW